ncbi:sigma-54 dependent transcriptional regulator [Burkholderia sp. L27(2015)]|uniref:sigma-54 dependent transcriptional regulator n=1 Tax=Burkholderia sp. L27(2015) TaxID=1641858 RepID=UPI00131DD096|nr:sigma-54 dependent transcriptional regulator [Burkholderia sp. L27(2015)]
MNVKIARHLLYVSRAPDPDLLALLTERGWTVSTAESLRDAQRLIAHVAPTVGLFDFYSGYTIEQVASFESIFTEPGMGWITTVSRAQRTQSQAQRLIQLHFFDFVTLPGALRHVVDAIDHAYAMIALDMTGSEGAQFHDTDMIGTCNAMQGLFRTIGKVANTDAPVLVCGESGTGKELTAAAIHKRSLRCKGPFVAINCGAIPHSLLQSELFGYERGAFTGAQHRQIGHVESAHGGTLFLDEIGDLPLESQVSLLRFLQERKIQRLGSHETVPVDVRVVSATHVDLDEAVRLGTFRADLYHRLCVLRLVEPPLRERGKDIEILAYHMLERFRSDSPRRIRGFSAPAIRALYSYKWPGNVRELINRVRRAIIMTEGRIITPDDLGLEHCQDEPALTLIDAREAAERHTIEEALARHPNHLSVAAEELGVSRATLYRLMHTHGLRVSGREAPTEHPSSEEGARAGPISDEFTVKRSKKDGLDAGPLHPTPSGEIQL